MNIKKLAVATDTYSKLLGLEEKIKHYKECLEVFPKGRVDAFTLKLNATVGIDRKYHEIDLYGEDARKLIERLINIAECDHFQLISELRQMGIEDDRAEP